MSKWLFTIEVDVDDESLADHDGKEKAPPNDPKDWDASDLFVADERGFVNRYESKIVEIVKLSRS